jgi:hypothetical protein
MFPAPHFAGRILPLLWNKIKGRHHHNGGHEHLENVRPLLRQEKRGGHAEIQATEVRIRVCLFFPPVGLQVTLQQMPKISLSPRQLHFPLKVQSSTLESPRRPGGQTFWRITAATMQTHQRRKSSFNYRHQPLQTSAPSAHVKQLWEAKDIF